MKKQTGFSLIELMIVVTVVAILATIAFPSYTAYVQKARRADAQGDLLDMANDQALWRASNPSYASWAELGSPTVSSYYGNPSISYPAASSTSFSISITAAGSQASDAEQGTSCTPLTYALNGATVTKTPAICWSR